MPFFNSSGALKSGSPPSIVPRYTGAPNQHLIYVGNSADYTTAFAAGQVDAMPLCRMCPAPSPASAFNTGPVNSDTIIGTGKDGVGKSMINVYPNGGPGGADWVLIGWPSIAAGKKRYMSFTHRIVPIELDHYDNTHAYNIKYFKFANDNAGPSGWPQFDSHNPITTGAGTGTIPQPFPYIYTRWELVSLSATYAGATATGRPTSSLVIQSDNTKVQSDYFTGTGSYFVNAGLDVQGGVGFTVQRMYVIAVDSVNGIATMSLTRGGGPHAVGTANATGGIGVLGGFWMGSDSTKLEMVEGVGFSAYSPCDVDMQVTFASSQLGFTNGTYIVTSIDPTTRVATMDRAVGTPSATGGTGDFAGQPYPNGFDLGTSAVVAGGLNFDDMMDESGAGGARDGNTSVGWHRFTYGFQNNTGAGTGDGFARLFIDASKIIDVSASAIGVIPSTGFGKQYTDSYTTRQLPYGGLASTSPGDAFSLIGGAMSSVNTPTWQLETNFGDGDPFNPDTLVVWYED